MSAFGSSLAATTMTYHDILYTQVGIDLRVEDEAVPDLSSKVTQEHVTFRQLEGATQGYVSRLGRGLNRQPLIESPLTSGRLLTMPLVTEFHKVLCLNHLYVPARLTQCTVLAPH